MSSLTGGQLVLLNNESHDSIIYKPPVGKREIFVGSDPNCDIRIYKETVRRQHLKIYVDSAGKTKVAVLHSSDLVTVNQEHVDGKKVLKSDDLIELDGCKMRWETKAEARRKTELMSRSERKDKKSRCQTTRKRITMYHINSKPTSNKAPALKKQDETPLKAPEPVKEEQSTPARINKENFQNSPKLSALNMSGTLVASIMPTVQTPTRSSSRISKARASMTAFYTTPAKGVLGETSNLMEFESPNSSRQRMHLIDLTTPAIRKSASSTPLPSSSRKTPTKMTPAPRTENKLLKSVLKNSTIKKIDQKISFADINPRQSDASDLSTIDVSSSFEETSKEENSASVLRTSSKDIASLDEASVVKTSDESTQPGFTEYSGVASLLKTPTTTTFIDNEDEDYNQLMESISSVLDENDVAKGLEDSNDKTPEPQVASETQDIERNFQDIYEKNQSTPAEPSQSLFTSDVTDNIDQKFDELIGRKSVTKTYLPQKISQEEIPDAEKEEKMQGVLQWIEGTRNSLMGEPNQTQQVSSERYSDITPNTSSAGCSNAPQRYDASTPKVSILQAIGNLRKSCGNDSSFQMKEKLAISPVTRLSLVRDNTEILENFNASNMHGSLRSTRKKFTGALGCLQDLNQSQMANTTADTIEFANASAIEGADMSETGAPDILSLDVPQTSNGNHEDQMQLGQVSSNASNCYIQFAEENDEGEKTLFEISSDGSSADDLDNPSDASELSESEESTSEEDEPIEVESKADSSSSAKKFSLKEGDLDDLDGINPLDDSRTDEPEEEEEISPISSASESQPILVESSALQSTGENIATITLSSATSNVSFDTVVGSTSQQTEKSLITDKNQTVDEESEAEVTFDKTVHEKTSEEVMKQSVQAPKAVEKIAIDPQEAVSDQPEDSFMLPLYNTTLNLADTTSQNEASNEFEVTLQEQDVGISKDAKQDSDTAHSNEITQESEEQDSSFEESKAEEIDEEFEIPATQACAESSYEASQNDTKDVTNMTTEDDTDTFDEDFEIPATQAVNASSLDTSQFEDDSAIGGNGSESAAQSGTTEHNINESVLFSETEFSRVEIDDAILAGDGDGAPNMEDELQGLSDQPTFSKRAASLVPQAAESSNKSNRQTIVANSENSLSESFQDYVEVKSQLANVGDKPLTEKRGASMVAEEIAKIVKPRYTMVAQKEDPKFIEFAKIQNELKNVGNEPTEKRGTSLTPEEIAKTKKPRHTMIPQQDDLSGSFIEYAKIQNELKNVGDQPTEKRGASMLPEEITKPVKPRHTMVPQKEDPTFVKYAKIQNELKDVGDAPTEKRGVSLLPDEIVKPANHRMTLAPALTAHDELSGSFIDYCEKQKEMKNMSDEPSTKKRAASLTPEEIVRPATSRKTLAPIAQIDEEALSKSFVEYIEFIENKKELAHVSDQAITKRGASLNPEEIAKPGTSRKTLAPSAPAHDESLSESFVQEVENQKEILKLNHEALQVEVDIGEIDANLAALEAEIDQVPDIQVEAEEIVAIEKQPEEVAAVVHSIAMPKHVTGDDDISVATPTRRGKARVNYSALASGSTPKKTPAKIATPRRARFAEAEPVEVVSQTPAKIKAEPTIEEEPDEIVDIVVTKTPRRDRSASVESVDVHKEPQSSRRRPKKAKQSIIDEKPEEAMEVKEPAEEPETIKNLGTEKPDEITIAEPEKPEEIEVKELEMAQPDKVQEPEAVKEDLITEDVKTEPAEPSKPEKEKPKKLKAAKIKESEQASTVELKTPRRGRSASVDTAPTVEIKSAVSKRSVIAEEPEQSSSQTEKSEETSTVQLKTPRRGRSASVDTAPTGDRVKSAVSKRAARPVIIEDLERSLETTAEGNPVDNSQENEAVVETQAVNKTPSRRRGNRVNYADMASGTPSKPQETEAVKSKQVRGKKLAMEKDIGASANATTSSVSDDVSTQDEEAAIEPKKSRGKATKSAPASEKPKASSRSQKEKVEEEPEVEAPAKVTEKRVKKVEEEKVAEEEQPTTSGAAKKTTSRSKKPVEGKTARRGAAKRKATETIEISTDEDEAVPAPVTKKAPRNARIEKLTEAAEASQATPPKRSRRAQDQASTSSDARTANAEPEPEVAQKGRRGKKAEAAIEEPAKQTKKKADDELKAKSTRAVSLTESPVAHTSRKGRGNLTKIASEQVAEVKEPEKPTRAARKRAMSEDTEATAPKSRRGNKKTEEVETPETVPEPEKKSRRGAAKKEEQSVAEPEPTKKATRGKSAKVEESAAEPEPAKKVRGKPAKVDPPAIVEPEPVKKSSRSRAAKADTPEVEEAPQKRGRGKKVEPEPEATKKTPVKKPTKKVTIVTPKSEEQPKTSRAAKRPAVEEPVKRSTRSRK